MAASRIKVLISELNSTELDTSTEYDLQAATVYFDNTGSDIAASDIGAALVELSNRVGGNSFSRRFVSGQTVISESDEMILSDFVEIKPEGTLEVLGLLTILNF